MNDENEQIDGDVDGDVDESGEVPTDLEDSERPKPKPIPRVEKDLSGDGLSDEVKADVKAKVAAFKAARRGAPVKPDANAPAPVAPAAPTKPNPAKPTAAAPAPATPAAPGTAPAGAKAAPAGAEKPLDPPAGAPQQIIETAKKQAQVDFQQRKRDAELKVREKDFAEGGKYHTIMKADELLRTGNPLDFFNLVGVDWNDVLKRAALAKTGKLPVTPAEDPAIVAIKKQQEALDAKVKAQEERDRDRDVAAYQEHIAGQLAEHAEEVPTVLSVLGEKAPLAVFKLISLTLEHEGVTLDPIEAALKLEAELEAEGRKFLGSKKFQGSTQSAADGTPAGKPATPNAKKPATEQANSPTLTSKITPTADAAAPPDLSKMTRQQRIEHVKKKYFETNP